MFRVSDFGFGVLGVGFRAACTGSTAPLSDRGSTAPLSDRSTQAEVHSGVEEKWVSYEMCFNLKDFWQRSLLHGMILTSNIQKIV